MKTPNGYDPDIDGEYDWCENCIDYYVPKEEDPCVYCRLGTFSVPSEFDKVYEQEKLELFGRDT